MNVCIYRIPLGLSIVYPPSGCPSCGSPIAFYDNIPVLSYLILGGKCRKCRTPISVKYPAVETLMGVLSAALFYRFGPSLEFLVYFAFTAALVVVTFIDLKYQIIPDSISLSGIPIGFAASFFTSVPGTMDSLIGLLFGGGILLGIAVAYYLLTGNEGMGGGDIKLLAMIGAFTGWKGVILTLLAGSFTGALIGSVIMLKYGKDKRYPIPFGPFLALGAVLYVFYGEAIINWYIMTAVGG